LVQVENKPKGKVPARFAQKKTEESKTESSATISDDKPIKPAASNLDDLPISSK